MPGKPEAGPFIKGPSGLWVPVATTGRRSQMEDSVAEAGLPILRFSAVTMGWRYFSGEKAPLTEIAGRLKRYSLRQIAGYVARISTALHVRSADVPAAPAEWGGDSDFAIHFLIAAKYLSPETTAAILRRMRGRWEAEGEVFDVRRTVLFQERQLLNLFKLALLTVDAEAPDSAEGPVPMIEALLMLTDHLDPEEGEMKVTTDEGRSRMELYISANLLFNEGSHILHDFVRAHYLYIQHHPEVEAASGVDIPAAIEKATGLEAENLWRGLFALFATSGIRSLADLDAGRVAEKRSEYLSRLTGLSDAERDAWFGLAIWPVAALQERIRRDYSIDEPRWWDVLPFEERPLVEFDDWLFCVSVPLFQRLAGGAIQHRLLDENVFDLKERRRFLDTRGLLVEQYISEHFKRMFGDRFISEKQLQALAPNQSVCDGIIVYPDAVILLETKANAVRMETRHAANYSGYRETWRRMMRKAATQIESTLELIDRGAFISLGLDPQKIKDRYPVVTLFEQAIHPLTYNAIIDQDLDGHALVARINKGAAKPLQLLNVKEVEMCEMATEKGLSILSLLREKTATPEMSALSFHHYVHYKGETFMRGTGKWHGQQFAAITDAASEYYRAKGLPIDEEDEDA